MILIVWFLVASKIVVGIFFALVVNGFECVGREEMA